MGRHKAIPNPKDALTAILDAEKDAQMTDISNFKRLSLGAAIVVSAFGSISARPSPTARIRAAAARFVRSRDSNGTVYGKCSQTAQVSPKNKLKLAR